jgi:HK97 family phage portal protein
MKVQRTKYKFLGIPLFERAVSAESDLSNPAPWLYDALGSSPTSTGISITPENSLQFSAVYACVNVIADQLASFPKGIYKWVNERERQSKFDHPLQYLVDTEPNEFYSAFDFWHSITASVLLWGNGFAKIVRDQEYNVTGFWFYHPSEITIYYGMVGNQWILFYQVNETNERIPQRDMLHFKGLAFDGVQGKSVIAAFAKESIGLSVAAEKFGAKFFGNDTLMTKYLSHPAALSEDAKKYLQQSWQTSNAGLENAFKLKILEEGMKLENVGIPPEQAQFIATRQHQVEEICRWFKVQPHLIQHLLRSTNNNIEQQGIEFVTMTLTPWVTRFENELNRKIFTEKEKKKLYLKFNMNSLLRGDITARTAFYSKMFEIGAYSPNDIRELEDRNPREDGKGDEYYHPLNMLGSSEERPQAIQPNNINTQNNDTQKSIGTNSGTSR